MQRKPPPPPIGFEERLSQLRLERRMEKMRESEIDIDIVGHEPEWWVKVVEFLMQNWALPVHDDGKVTLLFLADTSGTNEGVFDRLTFPDLHAARVALAANGFKMYSRSPILQRGLAPPPLPLKEGSHDNGAIYSSGRFWRSPDPRPEFHLQRLREAMGGSLDED